MPTMPRPLKAKKIALKIMKKHTDLSEEDTSMSKEGSRLDTDDAIKNMKQNPRTAGYIR